MKKKLLFLILVLVLLLAACETTPDGSVTCYSAGEVILEIERGHIKYFSSKSSIVKVIDLDTGEKHTISGADCVVGPASE